MADNDYTPGSMDTTEQEKTFDGFLRWSVRIAIVAVSIVVLLALFAQ